MSSENHGGLKIASIVEYCLGPWRWILFYFYIKLVLCIEHISVSGQYSEINRQIWSKR